MTSAVLFLGLSCGGPALPGLGKIKLEQLCNDPARCDAHGDATVSTLKGRKARPVFLAAKQGPESYLGKVAPDRRAESVLKTCGGDVVRDDWLESVKTVRTVELTSDGKKSLRAALRAHLAQELLDHPELLAGQSAGVDAVVDAATNGISLQRVSMVSQTYWLSDSAFERRVGQCGEEEYENIIYSLTLLQLSDLTRQELEAKLEAGLVQKLGTSPATALSDAPPDVEASGGELPEDESAASDSATAESPRSTPDRAAVLHERAFSAVQALASELRLIAAFGYDEK